MDGLKPDRADPVVRRAEHHYALGAMEAGWKEGDNRVREELATTQTLAQELKARVDELAALKAQVDFVVAQVPDDLQSQWIQGLYLELEQRVQEDVKRRLDGTLKEYLNTELSTHTLFRDSSTTHQQNQQRRPIRDRHHQGIRKKQQFFLCPTWYQIGNSKNLI